jgi:hypothetical protein
MYMTLRFDILLCGVRMTVKEAFVYNAVDVGLR